MEEEYGITLGEICKIIFKRVWWVIGVTAAFILITVLLVQFWYNPTHRQYSVSYNVRFPNSDSGQYPDGTALLIRDSVLLSSLKDVKEGTYSDDEDYYDFSNVNIEEMLDNDGISISPISIKEGEDEKGWSDYRLTVSAEYFNSKEQAVAFIKAVAEYPVNKAKYIVNNSIYDYYLTQYNLGSTYEAKIDSLVNQKNYVLSIYEFIKSTYGESYRPLGVGDKTITDYINEATAVFDSRIQSSYYNIVTANYYVWDTDTYERTANASIEATKIEIANNEAIIAALEEKIAELDTSEYDRIEAYHSMVASYVEKNAQLNNEIKTINDTLEKIKIYQTDPEAIQAKAEFDAALDSTRANLATLTETAKKVRIATYQNESSVLYLNNVIDAQGGINIIIAAIMGAILGFVIVSVVILIIDMPEYKKRKYEKNTEDIIPSTTE